MGDDRIAGCAYSANSAKAYCDFLLTGIYIAGHEAHEEYLRKILFLPLSQKPFVSFVSFVVKIVFIR